MNIRKSFRAALAVMCIMAMAAAFTACGGDDDPDNGGNPERAKIVGYQVDYSLEFPKETTQAAGLCGNLYLLCDKIEVGYIDENGQEQREVVTNGKWSKTVTYKKALDGYLKLYSTKPTSIDEGNLSYEYYTRVLTMMPNMQLTGITEIYSDGTRKEPTGGKGYVELHISSITIGKNKVQQYLENSFKSETQVMTIKLNI